MVELNKLISDYHLWLTIFGSITYFAFILVNKLNADKEGTPITFWYLIGLFVSFVIISIFSYIFFYDDIQKGSNKVAIMIGLSSYYFISKTITSFGRK